MILEINNNHNLSEIEELYLFLVYLIEKDSMWYTALNFVEDKIAAEDVMQIAFEKLIKKVDVLMKLDIMNNSLSKYVYIIVRNTAINILVLKKNNPNYMNQDKVSPCLEYKNCNVEMEITIDDGIAKVVSGVNNYDNIIEKEMLEMEKHIRLFDIKVPKHISVILEKKTGVSLRCKTSEVETALLIAGILFLLVITYGLYI